MLMDIRVTGKPKSTRKTVFTPNFPRIYKYFVDNVVILVSKHNLILTLGNYYINGVT